MEAGVQWLNAAVYNGKFSSDGAPQRWNYRFAATAAAAAPVDPVGGSQTT